MQRTIWTPLMAILLASTLLLSCKKEKPYMNNGVITGVDNRYCACCGGLMISFTGETIPYMGDFSLIDNPAITGISSTDKFPVYVKVDWKQASDACNRITVTRIARQ